MQYGNLLTNKYIFPPCPHRRLIHVNDIIVWHNGRKYDYVNTIGRKIIDEAPPWFYIGNTHHIGGKLLYLRFNYLKIIFLYIVYLNPRKSI